MKSLIYMDGRIFVEQNGEFWTEGRKATHDEAAAIEYFRANPPKLEIQPEFEVPDLTDATAFRRLDVMREFVAQMEQDAEGSRWGLHGRSCVDDDYFCALAYVVERAKEILGPEPDRITITEAGKQALRESKGEP